VDRQTWRGGCNGIVAADIADDAPPLVKAGFLRMLGPAVASIKAVWKKQASAAELSLRLV
jgi:hypothetical protein